MAKKPETKFKEKFLPRLRKLPKSWWLKTQMLSILGIPDLLGCYRGFFVAIELKKGGATLREREATKLQAWVLSKIRAAGGYAVVATPENADQILQEIKNLPRKTKA